MPARPLSFFKKFSYNSSFLPIDSEAAKSLAKDSLDQTALKSSAFQLVADKLPGDYIDKLHSALGITQLPSIYENDGTEKENKRKSNPVADVVRASSSLYVHTKTLQKVITLINSPFPEGRPLWSNRGLLEKFRQI